MVLLARLRLKEGFNTSMSVILFGAPGAGKGTQSSLIASEYGYIHLSTGDMLRREIANETQLGLQVKEMMSRGALVPDSLVISIIEKEILKNKSGFVLDGFPRTLSQATELESLINKISLPLPKVILIDVRQDALLARLTSRRVCTKCGAVFNVVFNPPKNQDICDICGEKLYQRDDDKESVIVNRLAAYEENMAPLRKYYSENGRLQVVSGDGDRDFVFAQIKNILSVNK